MKKFALILTFMLSSAAFADCQQDLSKHQGNMDDRFLAFPHCSAYQRTVEDAVYSQNAVVGALAFVVGLATIFPQMRSLRDEVKKTCESLDKFTANYTRELSDLSCDQLKAVKLGPKQVGAVAENIASCTQDGWNGYAYDDFVALTGVRMATALKAAKSRCR